MQRDIIAVSTDFVEIEQCFLMGVRVAVAGRATIHQGCESIYTKILLNIGGSDYLSKDSS